MSGLSGDVSIGQRANGRPRTRFPGGRAARPGMADFVCSEIGRSWPPDAAPVLPPAATAGDLFWEPLLRVRASLQQSLSVSAVRPGRRQRRPRPAGVRPDQRRPARGIVLPGGGGERTGVPAEPGEPRPPAGDFGPRGVPIRRAGPLWGTLDGFPSFLANPLAGFLEESRSRMVTILPPRKNVPHERIEQDSSIAAAPRRAR